MRIRIFLFSFLVVGIISCTSVHQKNQNSVFNRYDYNSERYKSELKQLLKTGKHLNYYFRGYMQEEGEEYILVDVRRHKLSAHCRLLVNDWNGLEKLRQTKGKGYVGSKLNGLDIEIENHSGKLTFVCKDIRQIVD